MNQDEVIIEKYKNLKKKKKKKKKRLEENKMGYHSTSVIFLFFLLSFLLYQKCHIHKQRKRHDNYPYTKMLNCLIKTK